MNRDGVQRWLERYIEAWRANEAEPIEALFTDDAVYRYRPYGGDDHTDRSRPDIVRSWLEDNVDEPDAWEAAYEVYAVDDDRAVAVGYSRYLATAEEPARTYHNCFLLRFADDGRCAEFTEYYMEEPAADSSAGDAV